jgi:CubicO group peptidase (beta-lactamase class C family)
VSEVQEQVQQTLDKLVESGAERGVQVAVYRGGEQVVDAVAGVADPASGRPVGAGTVFYNFSTVKGATTTVVHVLAERGLFGYDTPVADLWPEFAAHGKGAVTVRQVLNHTAGVPGVPPDTTVEDLCDWDRICAAVADAELWWEPGTKVGYHAYTFGYILGEVVRRVTGKPISQVLREEVSGPLGVADELWFGMPASEHHRLAPLEDEPGAAELAAQMLASMPPDLPMFRSAPMSLFPSADFGNRPDTLAADIPAGGKTSARAIARMYAALLGQVDGVRLLTPERLAEATAVSSSGTDEVFGMPTTWGLGYGIGGPAGDAQNAATVFGLGGVGGSFACGDTATGVAWAVTKNRVSNDFATSTQLGQLIAGSA